MNNQYWRSLDELSGTPEFQEFVKNEFPDLANGGDLTTVGRRRFMQLMGASMALGSAGCWQAETIMPFVRRPHDTVPGETRTFASALDFAGAGLALSAITYDGRPIKLDGNPSHPVSKGGSDPMQQGAVLGLYDPDRSNRPVRKTPEGAKGAELATLRDALDAAVTSAGAKLRVLTRATGSPSLQAQLAAITRRFPGAKVVEFESVSRDNERAGAQLALGQVVDTHWDFTKAQVIAAFDDDFFGDHPARTKLARDWAAQRDPNKAMNRIYSVESHFSITGASADHHLPLRASHIKPFLLALEAKVRANLGLPPLAKIPSGGFLEQKKVAMWLTTLAKDLADHRGTSVVTVGYRQPAEVHAIGHRINHALGNVGQTVTYTPAVNPARSDHYTALRGLVNEMNQGAVETLVILDGNPVYEAPGDLDFKAALAKVKNSFHLGLYHDETAELCSWHCPQSHDLESWGDVRSHDGTYTVVQPLIQPLYPSLSRLEMAAQLAGVPRNIKALELVRGTSNKIAGFNVGGEAGAVAAADATADATETAAAQADPQASQDEVAVSTAAGAADAAAGLAPVVTIPPGLKAWRKALSEGWVAGTAMVPVAVELQSFNAGDVGPTSDPGEVKNGELEVTFFQDGKVYDGRFANNGWLQELPDFLAKLTWDNAALMSPKTAAELKVKDEDLVSIKDKSGGELVLPVYILPGQATGSISVAIGYGRTRAGGVGGHLEEGVDPVGADVRPLRSSASPWVVSDVTVTRTSGRYELASTQNHWTIDNIGRETEERRSHTLVRSASQEDYRANPNFAKDMDHHPPLLSLFEEHEYKGHKWGLAIDLTKCIGCNACQVACQAENNIPVVGKERVLKGRELSWIRIDRYFQGTPEDPEVVSQPVTCGQCENAPCEQVCPVAATTHSEEGLNDMAYNRCIGTRYCANNCPYKVRRFNYFNYTKHYDEPKNQTLKLVQNPEVTVRFRGVMEKCTYCVQRITKARQVARIEKRQIRDGDISPACEDACPTRAITFGDLNDPNSRVAKLQALKRSYALLAELNLKPRTQYLAKVKNPHPELNEVKKA